MPWSLCSGNRASCLCSGNMGAGQDLPEHQPGPDLSRALVCCGGWPLCSDLSPYLWMWLEPLGGGSGQDDLPGVQAGPSHLSGSSWKLLAAELGGSWQSLRLGRPFIFPGFRTVVSQGCFCCFLCVYRYQQAEYFLMPLCCAKSHLHECLLSVSGLSVWAAVTGHHSLGGF